jgi:hypothetical protein
MVRLSIILIVLISTITLNAQKREGFSWLVQTGMRFNKNFKKPIYVPTETIKILEIPTSILIEYKYKRYTLGAGLMLTYMRNNTLRDTNYLNCNFGSDPFLNYNFIGFDYTQRRVNISFPLYTNYYFINRPRFSAFAQAGLRPDFTFYFQYKGLFKACKRFEEMPIDPQTIRLDTDFTEFKRDGVADILFGIGCNYHFEDGKALRLLVNLNEKLTISTALQIPFKRK